MRLIDADALKERICGDCPGNDCTPDATDTVYGCTLVDSIDQMLTIDAEPVVRCGECKYMEPNGHCTQFADDKIRPSVSDYCSAGERKNGGAENG